MKSREIAGGENGGEERWRELARLKATKGWQRRVEKTQGKTGEMSRPDKGRRTMAKTLGFDCCSWGENQMRLELQVSLVS